MKFSLFLLILSFFHCFLLSGQGGVPDNKPSIIPPSPNMSSLGQYIEQPVNKYTGIPKINIPLYDIKTKDIEVPISLSYHAGGRKVEEVSSWVGLGWSLFAGGSVTRTVRGLPDDLFNKDANVTAEPEACVTYDSVGYLYCGADIDRMYNFSFETTDSLWFSDFMREVGMGAKDGIPDLFYFSFGNYSGQFVFDKNKDIKLIPQQDLKISTQRDTNGKEIIGFTITTPEGVEYQFTDPERNTVTTASFTEPFYYQFGIEYKLDIGGPFFGLARTDTTGEVYNGCGSGGSRMTYNAAWQLTKIKSLRSGETVDLFYRKENIFDCSYSGESFFIRDTTDYSSSFISKSAVANFSRTKVIDSISWAAGSVKFGIDTTAKRKDLFNKTGNNYALKKVTVRNNSDSIIKAYNFTYSYFVSDLDPNFTWDYDTINLCERLDTVNQYRLKLTDIQEAGSMPFSFYYSAINMPHRASSKQDFWGYYTNATGDSVGNTGNKFPVTYQYPGETVNDSSYYYTKFSVYPRSSYTGSQVVHSNFAINRTANDSTARAWILTQINYPTGGSTEFNYDLNEFYVNGQKVIGGGLRLREQRNFAVDLWEKTTTFNYHESGKTVDLPVFARKNIHGIGGVTYETSWTSGLGLTQGCYVGYTKVSESSPGGTIIDSFLLPATYGAWNEEYFKRPAITKKYWTYFPIQYGSPNCVTWFDPAVTEFESFPKPQAPNYDFKRGLPVETSIYDTAGHLRQRTKNFYVIKEHEKIPNMQVEVAFVDMYSSGLGQNNCFMGRHCYNLCRSYTISPWLVLDSTVTIKYEVSDSIITYTKNQFAGSGHKNMIGQTSEVSDGNKLINKFKYPSDFTVSNSATDTAAVALRLMKKKNILSIPIETSQFIVKGGTEYLRKASLSSFKYLGSDSLILQYKNYKTANAAVLNDFQPSSISANVFTKDSRYEEESVYSDYDSLTNPLAITRRGNEKTLYLWDYDKTLPVAKLINAGATSDFAYTSFETAEKGGWSYSSGSVADVTSPTGFKVGSISNSAGIYRTTDENVIYRASVWVNGAKPTFTKLQDAHYDDISSSFTKLKSIGSWDLYEGNFTGSEEFSITNLSGSTVYFDEVRLCPKASFMTSYTYMPLVGITSECDANGMVRYYEYDTYRRLKYIKDENRNILKRMDYKFQATLQD